MIISYYDKLTSEKIHAARKAGEITEKEKNILINYISAKQAENITASRIYEIAHYLLRIRGECNINYETATAAEIQTAFTKIKYFEALPNGLKQIRTAAAGSAEPDRQQEPEPPQTIKTNTAIIAQRIFKGFILWLADTRQNKHIEYKTAQRLRPQKQDFNTLKESDLLTPAELKRLFEQCRSPRDAALFRTLYTGALRISELCNLQFKDVINIDAAAADPQDKSIIIFIQTSGKTKIQRKIPIIDEDTRGALFNYIKTYPAELRGPESYVFLNNHSGKPLTPGAVTIQLKRIAEAAGIEKPIHPHLLRHMRITAALRDGVNETHVKLLAWGNQNTAMLNIYSHLTPADIAAELMKAEERKQQNPG